MPEETPNPFQATFPANSPPPTSEQSLQPPTLPITSLPSTGGRVGRYRTSKAAKATRSAPITRPRKTASKKKASAVKVPGKRRGRPPKTDRHVDIPHGYSAPPAAPVVKRGRKPAATSPAKGVMIELGAAMRAMAGLQQEDAVLLSQIVTALLQKPKDTRTRIIAAIGKVLA